MAPEEHLDLNVGPWTKVDGPSLACAAAALQLVPENIPRLLPLERLAAIGASLPVRPEAPVLTPSGLRSLLRRPELVAAEDPYEDLYVEEVVFFDGPRRVLQGLTNRSAHTLRLLLSTIFDANSALSEDYRGLVQRTSRLVLAVSNAICVQADLQRGLAPRGEARPAITVPSRQRLSELMNALTFNNQLVRRAQEAALNAWFIEPGQHRLRLQDGGPDEGLILTPFLKVPAGAIVINPGELAARLRHHIILTAIEMDCKDSLASAFRRTVLSQVQELVLLMDAEPITSPTTEADGLVLRQQFAGASETVIDLAVCTDDLSDYDAGDPYGHWNQNPGSLAQEVLDPPGGPRPADFKTLRLAVTDGFARSAFLGLEALRRPGPMLLVPLDELRVMVDLDGADPLFLWYFAQADERFHAQTEVISFAVLDTYAVYRDHESSFYLNDGPHPTVVSIVAGEGLPLRVEAQRRTDRHYVSEPSGTGYVELMALYGRDIGPVYFVHPRHNLHADVVEAGGLRFWIRRAQSDKSSIREVLNKLLEAVAYWIWQLEASLHDSIVTCLGHSRNITICVAVDDSAAWIDVLKGAPDSQGDRGESWVSASWTGDDEIAIKLQHSGASTLFAKGNEADRYLVASLTSALLDSDGDACREIIEKVAPVGPKRMIAVRRSSEIRLRPALRPARMVRAAVTSELMDDLGRWLATNNVLSEGPVDSSERTTVLNQAVSFYFERLQSVFSQLSSEGLLKFLVTQDEALLAEAANRIWHLPSQLACFGSDSVKGSELLEREQEQIAASIASRFLIEYAVAVPPRGKSPIDLLVYDHLLAIADELISRASLSDAIKYGFSDVMLSLLRSGRLGVSRGDSYTAAAREVLQVEVEARRLAALGDTAEEDTPALTYEPDKEAAALLQAIDTALRDEFCLSLTDIYNGLYALVRLGDRIGGEAVVADVDIIVAHLQRDLGWVDEVIDAFQSHLSLRPRGEFLSIGIDAYPWRHNRNVSYLRRPLLVITPDEGPEQVCWGQRRLEECARYWHGLLLSGKMRASRRPLTVLMSTIRQDANKQFEQSTEAAFARCGFAYTDNGVKKIEGKRLVDDNGEDLGDIDAIAYDPSRNVLVVAESKDLEMARTPFELANEVDALTAGNRNAVSRVSARSAWVRNNLDSVLKYLGAPRPPRNPNVEPLVVTSRTLIASKVVSTTVPILGIDEVAAWVTRLNQARRQDRQRPNKRNKERKRRRR